MSKRRGGIFSDECAIYRSSRSQNIVLWSKQNPHYGEEMRHHPPHVIVWVEIISEHLFGPYFFDGPVNHFNYLAMLKYWFFPQLQSHGNESNVWFQKKGTPAHFATTARNILK